MPTPSTAKMVATIHVRVHALFRPLLVYHEMVRQLLATRSSQS